MNWSLRKQLILPLTAFLLVAVCANALTSALMASHRSRLAREARQAQIAAVLIESPFPRVQKVLEQLSQLTGDEFVIWDSADPPHSTSTIPLPKNFFEQLAPFSQLRPAANEGLPIRLQADQVSYRGLVFVLRGGRQESLAVLAAESDWLTHQSLAMLPPLAVGAITLLVLVPLGVWWANRLSQRVADVQQQVARVAEGDFSHVISSKPPHDEMGQLAESVNDMSRRLLAYRDALIRSERLQTMSRLATGLAHQLRNAITGAKLAIQLHLQRSPGPNQALQIAIKQLTVVEGQLRGLLSLGKEQQQRPVPIDVSQLLEETAELLQPVCEHQQVTLTLEPLPQKLQVFGQRESLQAAVLNLLANAVDAAGPGGQITLQAQQSASWLTIDVLDNGTGPDLAIQSSLFEPFATTKPDGTGLGLAVATQVAQDHGGQLSWARNAQLTRFRLQLPLSSREPGPQQNSGGV